jgi:hypothetical protein
VDGVPGETLGLKNLVPKQVTRVAGYPRSPAGDIDLIGFLMVEADNSAWRVFSDQITALLPDGRQDMICTAPFFVD